MQVVAGSLTLGKDVPIGQTIIVEKATRHENYKETSTAVYNDIGDICTCSFSKLCLL
jgi:hypothetical protein